MTAEAESRKLASWFSGRRRLWLLTLAAAMLLAAGWLLLRPPAYHTQPAKLGEAVDIVYATGIVDHVREADIAPVVSQPIRRVLAEEGQMVRRGQLLAQLEDGPAQATAAQLGATAATARLSADRAQRLFASGFGSAAARDETRGQYRAAEAAARAARAHLQDYAVRAPFDGKVLRRDAEPGDLAQPSKPLFVVADEKSLRITADLDERDIARVTAGQKALIRADAFSGQSSDAVVSDITPQGDSNARIFRVRLKPAAGAPLKAGMTVEANIVAGRRSSAVLAAASAVKEDTLWVVDARRRVELRKVQRGAAGGEWVEIKSGVKEGEILVLDPGDNLKDGKTIRIKKTAAKDQGK